jgi:hypothetical protein
MAAEEEIMEFYVQRSKENDPTVSHLYVPFETCCYLPLLRSRLKSTQL